MFVRHRFVEQEDEGGNHADGERPSGLSVG